METKTCVNCKNNFVIEPEDFRFYEKIQVPPPTWCPECRFMRRMSWRNEWRLFRKKSDHSGEEIISLYSPESYARVYENDFWYSDNWDPLKFGRDYDWNKNFFLQFRELMGSVPMQPRSCSHLVNSDYAVTSVHLKNCYLVANSGYTEDSAYMIADVGSKFSLDLHMTERCELCYDSVNLIKCYRTSFSKNCELCDSVILCRDCVSCKNCFGCANLRHKSFYIFNRPYTKEEYFAKLKDFNLGSAEAQQSLREQAQKVWRENPVKFTLGRRNANVSGDYIYNSKNAVQCYRVKELEDSKYCQHIQSGPAKSCYDYSQWGEGIELMYDSAICGVGTTNLKFCCSSWLDDIDLTFCVYCLNSRDLFGCVSLRNKRYCILNKQYSKEEYFTLVEKIKKHMNEMPYVDKQGIEYRYGEFFPPELSPHEYNTTLAQEYFPLTKEQAVEKGYSWKDLETPDHPVSLPAGKLPDNIKDVPDSILQETIGCAHAGKCNDQCTLAFKIIPQELEFYRKMNLPLPRLCPNCRHYQRIKSRNPFKLHHRKCQCAGGSSENGLYQNTSDHPHHSKDQPCPNEFETTYAPNRPGIVYCEECYVREVR